MNILYSIVLMILQRSQSNKHTVLQWKIKFWSVYSGLFKNYKVDVEMKLLQLDYVDAGHARLTVCSKIRRYSSVSGSFQINRFTKTLAAKSNG